jgi:hypothetical protein
MITEIFIVLSIIIILGFDIFLVLKYGKDKTITHVIIKYSKLWPIIPFAFGFLMGHFYG